MSNIAGKAYGMTVITPMKPARTWINYLIFMVARVMPGTLSGLLGLSLIHFARWVIVRRSQWPGLGQGKPEVDNDYMIFCSNFNGTWDQYIDAFSDGIPNGLDFFWYSSTKYPSSVPITPFKSYISHNQIQNNYYYNATPGSAQRDIKSALRVHEKLRHLAQMHPAHDAGRVRRRVPQGPGRRSERPRLAGCGAGGQPGRGQRRTEPGALRREGMGSRVLTTVLFHARG